MTAGLILGWILLAHALAAAWALYHLWLRRHVARLKAREQRVLNDLEKLRTTQTHLQFDAIVTANQPWIPSQRTEEPS